ncbi:MAG: hypothetical protein Q7K42_03675 [Candidatus Diapherotrites archaeon]|nr:hypothetical protein [Candidatus Diapherotrites archaeon]
MPIRRKQLGKGRKESLRKFQARKSQSLTFKPPEEFRTVSFDAFVRKGNNFAMTFLHQSEIERRGIAREFNKVVKENSALVSELREIGKDQEPRAITNPWFVLLRKLKNPFKSFVLEFPEFKMRITRDLRERLASKKRELELLEKRKNFGMEFDEARIGQLRIDIKSIELSIAKVEGVKKPEKDSALFDAYKQSLETERIRNSSKYSKEKIIEGTRFYSKLYKLYKAFRRLNPEIPNKKLFS